ncbi:unnamed protein product [Parajaminaea phylloscopi]
MSRREQTANYASGSRTQTIEAVATAAQGGAEAEGPEAGPSNTQGQGRDLGVLRLRGGHTASRRVVWSDDTVDNEGLGRKKSKICCIYHKPRAFDESSSEGSSSSDSDSSSSDSDSDSDCGSTGSGRSGRSLDGPMASSAWRQARGVADPEGSDGGEAGCDDASHPCRDHQGEGEQEGSRHKHRRRHRHKGKSTRHSGSGGGGSRTAVLTATTGPETPEGGGGATEAERPKKNAYERGPR